MFRRDAPFCHPDLESKDLRFACRAKVIRECRVPRSSLPLAWAGMFRPSVGCPRYRAGMFRPGCPFCHPEPVPRSSLPLARAGMFRPGAPFCHPDLESKDLRFACRAKVIRECRVPRSSLPLARAGMFRPSVGCPHSRAGMFRPGCRSVILSGSRRLRGSPVAKVLGKRVGNVAPEISAPATLRRQPCSRPALRDDSA